MTYLDAEQSTHGGKPIELYRYAGTYTTFRYTSAPKKVSFQADDETQPYDYIPIAMKRSAVNQTTQNDDNGEITIDLPVKTDLVVIYGFQIAPPQLELTIFRGHNLDYIRYWNGDVENVSVVRGVATIRVPARLAAALNTDLPNVFFQSQCNHTLYDARCGIKFDDWSETTTITAVGGKAVSVAAVAANLQGKLVGGDAILPSGERRMIVSQDGLNLAINYPFSQAVVGGEIILAAGCDLAWAGDCDTRFNNTKRFGGFPFIPNDNVFESTLEPGKNYGGEPCLPDCKPPFDHYEFWSVHLETAPPGMWGRPGLGNVLAFNSTGPQADFVDWVCGDPNWFGGRVSHFAVDAAHSVNIPEQLIRHTMQGMGGDVGCKAYGAGNGVHRMYVQGPGWPGPRLCPPDSVTAGAVEGTGLRFDFFGLFPETGWYKFFPDFDDPRYIG